MPAIRRIGLRHWALSAALLLTFGAGARADIIGLTATLTGAQESPPNTSPGTGSAALVLNTTAATLVSAVTFSNLTGTTTSADIEDKSGVILHALPTIPTGVTQGNFTDIWTGLTAANIAALENGGAYVNIRTSAFPGGEIRGLIVSAAVPEPGPLVLLGTGLLGLLGVRCLRR
jgi:hypothetical protein